MNGPNGRAKGGRPVQVKVGQLVVEDEPRGYRNGRGWAGTTVATGGGGLSRQPMVLTVYKLAKGLVIVEFIV